MKKFLLMILAISMFFVGLGGLAKQAISKFESDEQFVSSMSEVSSETIDDENIEAEKKFTIVKKLSTDISVNDLREKVAGRDFKIYLPEPARLPSTIQFQHQLSGASLIKRAELPRLPARNLIIIRTDKGGKFKISDSEKVEITQAKEFSQPESETK